MKSCISVGFLLLSSFPSFAVTSSPEEAAVQQAYARAAYSTELNSINHAMSENLNHPSLTAAQIEKAKEAGAVHFVISDFRQTARANFGESRFDSLELSFPDGFLMMGGSSMGFSEVGGETEENEFNPIWSTAPTYWRMDVSRYAWVKEIATYTVTATFKGLTRTGTAYAFFGDTQKTIEDKLVGSMDRFATQVSAYPILLLHVGSYDSQAVRDYLKATQVESGCCGPLANDVQRRLNQVMGFTDGTPIVKHMLNSSIQPGEPKTRAE